MDKSLAQSTISKRKQVSGASESEDDCDKKCKNPETIKSVLFAFLENWKIDYHASSIPDRSKPQ